MNIADTIREKSHEAEMRGHAEFDIHEFRDLHSTLTACCEMQETLESDVEDLEIQVSQTRAAVLSTIAGLDDIAKVVEINEVPEHFKKALLGAVQECRKRMDKINPGRLNKISESMAAAIGGNDISH